MTNSPDLSAGCHFCAGAKTVRGSIDGPLRAPRISLSRNDYKRRYELELFFFGSHGKLTNCSILFRVSPIFSSAKYLKNTFANRRETNDKAAHRAGARCEPCAPHRHSPLYGIDQGHPQPHSQAMAGRRKRRARRELSSSSRQSRLTDIVESNTKSRAISLSWRALSYHVRACCLASNAVM